VRLVDRNCGSVTGYSTERLTMGAWRRTVHSTCWLIKRRDTVPADALSQVFSALADPTRRDMVSRLAVADATVNELAEPYDMSVQAVSKHLKVLEEAGLVSRSREAQRRPVHLEAEVFDLVTKWIERYRRQAQERYRRLDDVLRSMADDVSPTPPETGAGT
jgi:DNA-binding transcriptional ArsR family regulator